MAAEAVGAGGSEVVSPGSEQAFKLALSLREKSPWDDADVKSAIDLLSETDVAVFMCVVSAIMGKGGRPQPAIVALNNAYKSSAGKKRVIALVALREFPDQREEIKAHIKSMLMSKDLEATRLAFTDLLYFPGLFDEYADQVNAILKDEESKKFQMAHLLSLSPLIRKSPSAIPQSDVFNYILIASQDKAAKEVALTAAGILYQALDSQREGIKDVLSDGLKDESPLVSAAAIVSVLHSNAPVEKPLLELAIKRSLLSGDEKIIRFIIKRKDKITDKSFDLMRYAREVSESAAPESKVVLDKVLSEFDGQ